MWKYFHLICSYTCFFKNFHDWWFMWVCLAHCEWCLPSASGPGMYKKESFTNHKEQASKQYSSRKSLSISRIHFAHKVSPFPSGPQVMADCHGLYKASPLLKRGGGQSSVFWFNDPWAKLRSHIRFGNSYWKNAVTSFFRPVHGWLFSRLNSSLELLQRPKASLG